MLCYLVTSSVLTSDQPSVFQLLDEPSVLLSEATLFLLTFLAMIPVMIVVIVVVLVVVLVVVVILVLVVIVGYRSW